MTTAIDLKPRFLLGCRVRSVGQGRLYDTESGGAGPSLLFVHGGYHGAWCWSPLMSALSARGIPCAAVDCRGHGGLKQGEDYVRQGIWDYADDVAAAANALDGDVALIGHSLGALVCMAAAGLFPIAGIALLAPSPPGQLEGLHPLPAYPADVPILPPDAVRSRVKFFGNRDVDCTAVAERLCSESPTALNDRYLLRIRIEREWIDGPALCVSAGNDDAHLHPPGQDRDTADFVGASYHLLEAAGHDMMLDCGLVPLAELISKWHEQLGRHVTTDEYRARRERHRPAQPVDGIVTLTG